MTSLAAESDRYTGFNYGQGAKLLRISYAYEARETISGQQAGDHDELFSLVRSGSICCNWPIGIVAPSGVLR